MPPLPMTPAVRARDLVVAYDSTVALRSSTFEAPTGGITAVIGPNGSGKSTLLGVIAGLVVPREGSIEVFGAGGAPARISYVLQSTKVNENLPVTVREIVTMGRYASAGAYGRLTRADESAVHEAMERMGVADLADRQLRELSGGQRQRVFVAQGLAQDHDILLLDEPLTGLDLISAQAIDDVIHEETMSGHTIVMTTHDLAEAQVAQHVLLLAGEVLASGPPAEVLQPDNLVAVYGPQLLHLDAKRIFIDDPAHRPVPGRHVHRDRSG